MHELDDVLQAAVARSDVPFVVAMVANREGVLWQGCAGDLRPGSPAQPRTVFRLFSMTKAVAGVAAMMLVERGRLSLDDEVAALLPEFSELGVIEPARGAGEPARLRRPRTPITVRHLATHTSGLAYEFWSAPVAEHLQASAAPGILSGTRRSMRYPLVGDAGERWAYGPGIDWLGLVIEAVDGRPVDRFVHEEVLAPLAMHETSFEPIAGQERQLAPVFMREADGSFVHVAFGPPEHPEVYGLGHALYGTAPDYLRFLRLILGGGGLDGTRLLSPAGVGTLLTNHIGELSVPVLRSTVPTLASDVDLLPGSRKTHGLAFMRFEEGRPGLRGPGSHGWAGALNTHYWLDPGRDIAAVFMTQSLPFAEPRVMGAFEAFERAVYRRWPRSSPRIAGQ